MDVQIIQKIFQQQKLVSIFLTDIQCKQFEHLIIQKQTYFISRKGLYEKIYVSLRKHAKNIIDFEKKNKTRIESHQNPIVYYICGKKILKKLSESINYRRVRDHCHFTGKYRREAWFSQLNKLNGRVLVYKLSGCGFESR